MTSPLNADYTVQALLSEAQRLGLMWRIVPGTVTGTPTDTNNVGVTIDNDVLASRAQSLIGLFTDGTRVMLLIVPPQNVYIIGLFGTDAVSNTGQLIERFTADDTWIDTGAAYIIVEAQGSGASGGGAPATAAGQHSKGGGGGGGSYARSLIPRSEIPSSAPIVVGAAPAGVSGANGVNGNPSSFDTTTVVGDGGALGLAGAAGAASVGVSGGAGSFTGTGDLLIPGDPGGPGWGTGGLGFSGQGGSSFFGGGGVGRATGAANQALAGNQGRGYGAGGSGALSTAVGAAAAGGPGAPGIVIVTSFFR